MKGQDTFQLTCIFCIKEDDNWKITGHGHHLHFDDTNSHIKTRPLVLYQTFINGVSGSTFLFQLFLVNCTDSLDKRLSL